MKAPGYIFLLAEYVGRMEALLTYEKIPDEVKESMRKRAQELKALPLDNVQVNLLIKELYQYRDFKNLLPSEDKYNKALNETKD